jgi:MFS transporter, FSR family, fosmidomycin resistance protein
LSYVQVGVALSAPGLVSLAVEPPLGILGDRGLRRRIVVAGGACFALALAGIALAPTYLALLAALMLFSPASGAFVSLSQATLMDSDPSARQLNMARWTLAGSIGVAAGPLLVATGAPWRVVFAAYAAATVALLVLVRRIPFDDGAAADGGFRSTLAALRSREVLRWLLLLELQDLGGDVLYGYLALYFVDSVGTDARTAALAVAAWTSADLAGNLVVLRVLRRVGGLRWLRWTAAAVAVVFPAFQLAPGLAPKLVLIALVGALHSGWYPISKARLYEALPGRSGTAMAVATTTGLLGAALPLALGLLAERVGLHDAFWLVLVAPLALLVAVPRREVRR